jgi:hypothetical protein
MKESDGSGSRVPRCSFTRRRRASSSQDVPARPYPGSRVVYLLPYAPPCTPRSPLKPEAAPLPQTVALLAAGARVPPSGACAPCPGVPEVVRRRATAGRAGQTPATGLPRRRPLASALEAV